MARMTEIRPLFSIIIATYNRPRQLDACLEGIAAVVYPREQVEVIVVDDGSHPPLESVLAPYMSQLVLHYLRHPRNLNVAVARNTGASAARGRYLVFFDDDCMPPPTWLQGLEDYVRAFPKAMIGGRTTNFLHDNLFSEAAQMITDMGQAYYNDNTRRARLISGNSMTFPAEEFHALGGFDSRFFRSQDREICDRWVHEGYQIVYAPDVVLFHAHSLNFFSFFRMHWYYGRGAYLFHRARAQRGSGTLLKETRYIRDLRNWLLYPLSHGHDRRKYGLVVLMIVWQIANTLGFFTEAARQALKRSGKETVITSQNRPEQLP